VPLLFRAGSHPSEQDNDQRGRSERDRSARHGGDLQPLGEGLSWAASSNLAASASGSFVGQSSPNICPMICSLMASSAVIGSITPCGATMGMS
jgi:hypothetical protein